MIVTFFFRLLTLLLMPALSLATAAPSIDDPHTQARIETLATTSTWHSLLHDYPSRAGRQGWSSQVDDPDFFLATDGEENPVAELRATLTALYQPVSDPNAHPVCRFPARWRWLSQQLSLPAPPLTPAQCPEFNQWLGIMRPHSVTLVFASAYLNSPSSMFGHTFLRIDPEHVESGSTWLSYAVNFGAEYHPEDNSILYAWKGLLGGYPGFFSVLPYHEKISEYNRIENRDLWEYRLNLTPDETHLLVWHLWELRNIDFDYFFFDENCSFRLLELLQLARPGVDLTSGFEVRAIPVDTVRRVQDAGLVRQVEYRPAAATDLQFQADQLTDHQQALAWDLAHRQRPLDDPQLTALPQEQQAQILRVAYKHLRYEQGKAARDDALAQHSLALLRALKNQATDATATPPAPVTPESGHDTLLVGIAGGRSDGRGLLDLSLRASYHDLADNPSGYLDGAAINLGEMQLRQREDDSLQIELLNFVDIRSHAPRSRFFSPITWRVQAGFDRVYAEDEQGETDDALTARVNGGAGITLPLGDRHLVFGMGMARLEYDKLLEENLATGAGALAGALFYLPIGTLQLESDYYRFSDGHERSDTRLIHNLPLGKNDAIRLNALHRKQVETRFDEFSLEYRHYF